VSHHSTSAERTPPPIDLASLHLLFDAVLAPRSAIYVSVPITGGRRVLEARSAHGGGDLSSDTARRLMSLNVAEARDLVRSVRSRTNRPVIDPAAIGAVMNWTQDDYRRFWGETVRRFAAEVVFADGFEFSDGCAYEYATAIADGVPVKSADGADLALAEGIRRLEAGREARVRSGAPVDVVDGALRAAKEAHRGGGAGSR
jgi:hypothetical protein